MDEALRTRLKLFVDNIELLMKNGQDTLQRFKGVSEKEVDLNEAQMNSAKLKSAIERFVTEMHNYYRLVQTPAVDELSKYTDTQIQAEELVVELNLTIGMKRQADQRRTCSESYIPNVASKLPKMELARFNGNVVKWHEFWDQFASNVDNRNISDVDKLLYLQSVLEGEAKRALEGLDTTNKNYQIAVATLKERYGKPSAIVDAHYAALYNVKAADKSVSDCRRVFNEIERHLRVLKSLGEDVNHNHLRVMIMQKNSEDLIYELRMKMGSESYSIEDIRSHIECIISAREASNRMKREVFSSGQNTSSQENRCSLEALQVISEKRPYQHTKRSFSAHVKDVRTKHGGNGEKIKYRNDRKFSDNSRKRYLSRDRREIECKRQKPSCIFCGNGHFNDECNEVKTVIDRKRKLEGRCFNCLAKGHRSLDCRSNKKCYHCGKYGDHNRALCPSKDPIKTANLHIKNSNDGHKGLTVLQTAIVKLGEDNKRLGHQTFRVLLDCGSQRSYITSKVADFLNLPKLETNILSVFTFGADRPNEIESPIVKLNLVTRTNIGISIYANVVPHITNSVPTIPHDLKGDLLKRILSDKIILADDSSMGDQVDILVGNDYYFSLITGDKHKISDNLYLVNSVFGWVWSGNFLADERADNELSVLTYFQSTMEVNGFCGPDLPLKRDDMRMLWDLESIGILDSPTASRDDEAIRLFNSSTQYYDGRYHVKWPWIEFPPVLPSNFGLAHGRLMSLLKRLDNDTIEAYDKILKEQLDTGIIETISDISDVEHPVHYLPHHCIARGDKLRLVYDASAKTKGNKSLNECLYRGPLLLKDLTGLLIRFREHHVAVVADVEKAFLQIGLHKEDRDVTRFLWLKNVKQSPESQNLLHLRFRRVPFGVISSPFLLNAVIRFHLKKSGDKIHDQIAEDLYVDNLVTGSNSDEDAIHLYKKARAAFSDLSMNLREWNSNSAQVKGSVPLQYQSKESNSMKVLGLNWNLSNDLLTLRFELTQKIEESTTTKREILRLIASIFDPCGFAVPLVLPAKLFLQMLWYAKVDWDTPFSEEMLKECKLAIDNLKLIKDITLPRCVMIKGVYENFETYELHAFCDASIQAYAAVVYLRITRGSGIKATSRIVMGKGRLVGKEQQTDLHIPKLELLGALIGSRLIQTVLKYTRLPITKLCLWTDSQIVISWCCSEKLLTPFVAKRVEEIKRINNLHIKYVPTHLNPADVGTRPNASNNDFKRWLRGPGFLKHDSTEWPIHPVVVTDCHAVTSNSSGGQGPTEGAIDVDEHQKSSSTQIDEEIIGQERDGVTERTGSDKVVDSQSTLRKIQTECYKEEMNGVNTNLGRSLGVYKDKDGLLRCGGRLSNTDWCYDQKHPILLPRDHEVTSKIIETTHQTHYHVGVSHTLSLIRKNYWIPKGRAQVQKVLRQCQSCRKYSGGPFKLPPMAPLPMERVTYSRPFTYTGLDYFGPITVGNNDSLEKRWVCLFTCLAVRAIHMEIVRDMTAEECLLAIRRFISTRGVPKQIVSDNATQFKLTSEVMTSDYCITNGTKWKFIPELAPWFGGFYERLVGLVKHCLKRTIDKHLLNDHQLSTVIKEVEAVVNSRPLTAVGGDLDHILTPADFLCTGGLSLPIRSEKEFLESATVTKIDLVDGWKRGQRILREYIEMFSNQYLASLRDRATFHKQPRVTVQSAPQVGQLLQIKGGSNRTLWKVGRISSVSKSNDGNIRVAKVSLAPNETLTRSISHLYPLEIPEDNSQSSNPSSEIHSETDTQVTFNEPNRFMTPAQVPAQSLLRKIHCEQPNGSLAQSSSNRLNRPSRIAAQKARDKVREWTAHLLSNLHI